MGPKRPLPASAPSGGDRSRRKVDDARRHPSPADAGTHAPSAINPLRKKVRDLTRLLQRSDSLPADVRVQHERALAEYQQDLQLATDEKRRQKIIRKYHMVRFFERKKAARMLKRLRKRLAASPSTEEAAELRQQIHQTNVDFHYAIYSPLDQKYTALYAAPATEGSDAKPAKPTFWKEVERRMEEGSNLDELRYGKTANAAPRLASSDVKRKGRVPIAAKPKPKQPEKKAARKGLEDKEASEGSDGGFFEE
ncbi:MAG: 18S rRNA maturation protein [Thelocarpon superellum]|nr:MAG: 18S rRNA maturation protein [Thelocarpon superellum]